MRALAIYVIFVYVINICMYTNIQTYKNMCVYIYVQKHIQPLLLGLESWRSKLEMRNSASETCFNIDPVSLFRMFHVIRKWPLLGEHPKKESIKNCGNVAFFFLHKKQNTRNDFHSCIFFQSSLFPILSPTISLLLLPGPPKTKKNASPSLPPQKKAGHYHETFPQKKTSWRPLQFVHRNPIFLHLLWRFLPATQQRQPWGWGRIPMFSFGSRAGVK